MVYNDLRVRKWAIDDLRIAETTPDGRRPAALPATEEASSTSEVPSSDSEDACCAAEEARFAAEEACSAAEEARPSLRKGVYRPLRSRRAYGWCEDGHRASLGLPAARSRATRSAAREAHVPADGQIDQRAGRGGLPEITVHGAFLAAVERQPNLGRAASVRAAPREAQEPRAEDHDPDFRPTARCALEPVRPRDGPHERAAGLPPHAHPVLRHDLDRIAWFEAVYGSLASIIVLLLWLYVAAFILVIGAEYSIARLGRRTTGQRPTCRRTTWPPCRLRSRRAVRTGR